MLVEDVNNELPAFSARDLLATLGDKDRRLSSGVGKITFFARNSGKMAPLLMSPMSSYKNC